jgi:hypothetical protein
MSAQMFQPPSHEDVQAGQEYEIAFNEGVNDGPAYPGVWRVESKDDDPTRGVTLIGPDGETRLTVLAWDLFPLANPEEGPRA